MKKYHRLGGLYSRNAFLTVLEAKKSKIKVLGDSVSVENPCPGTQTCLPHGGKDEGVLRGLSYKGTDPIQKGSALRT